ncbi:hypothetical protein [Arthrobacter sp. HLT1-20]
MPAAPQKPDWQVVGECRLPHSLPGLDLVLVHGTLFTALAGFKLFDAIRDTIVNPNLIFPGQIFRVPLLS